MKPLCIITCILTLSITTAVAQDVENGRKVFSTCKSCHMIGENAKHRIGPNLNNVIGRKMGAADGFKYSKTLKAANELGQTWDQATIIDYIQDPKAYMKALLNDPKAKPKMTFKLKDEKKRIDVVAYIATFSETSHSLKPTGNITQAEQTPPLMTGKICVKNSSDQSYYFTAESDTGKRAAKSLAPSAILCVGKEQSIKSGTVSVFENADAFEGCSRLVKADQVEKMFKYAEFDRCLWSSNAN